MRHVIHCINLDRLTEQRQNTWSDLQSGCPSAPTESPAQSIYDGRLRLATAASQPGENDLHTPESRARTDYLSAALLLCHDDIPLRSLRLPLYMAETRHAHTNPLETAHRGVCSKHSRAQRFGRPQFQHLTLASSSAASNCCCPMHYSRATAADPRTAFEDPDYLCCGICLSGRSQRTLGSTLTC